ncbi:MAG: sodium:solute symporter [Opitutaceae bacterium]|nr:sodium:solute symporter [Opitutaceae bacterium]
MTSLSTTDLIIIGSYFLITLIVGLVMTRKASRNLNEYFLGGRSLPWYLLGMAGMVSWFDLTGTMMITSFLYMLGPRGLFIEFRGGVALILPFMMAFTAKWHRRSGCMTAAEWMTYRFGHSRAANWMRLLTALMYILLSIGMLAYLIRGTSLFVGLFVPYPPMLVTAVLIAICAVYTMLSGFYGVVLTDLVQGLIIIVAAFLIGFIAWQATPDLAALNALAERVTGNAYWTSSVPHVHTTMPRGYEMYETLLMFALFYLLRNVIGGLGTGAESRYFGARSDRECGLQSMMQGLLIAFRWPLMISFAVLGLFLMERYFPRPALLEEAAAVVHRHYPDTPPAYWHDVTSDIVHRPEAAPAAAAELAAVLGPTWKEKLPLVSVYGTVNPEQILPAVLINSVPAGLRGFFLVAMLAAMMSTLTGTVNQAAAMMVRDIYQDRLRPGAGNRELLFASYGSAGLILVLGFWMGVNAGSINDLWGWLSMSLTAGMFAPQVLRLYWWRCNGWGVVGGTAFGCLGAIAQRIFAPALVEWQQLLAMTALSFASTIICSLLTAPPPRRPCGISTAPRAPSAPGVRSGPSCRRPSAPPTTASTATTCSRSPSSCWPRSRCS